MKTASNMYTIEHVLSEGESENIPTPTFQNQMMIEEIEKRPNRVYLSNF